MDDADTRELYVLNAAQETQPFHLTLGNGWTVSCMWKSPSNHGNLAACQFSSGNKHICARLDLGKRIFIDNIPTAVNDDVMNTLIKLIGWFSDGT